MKSYEWGVAEEGQLWASEVLTVLSCLDNPAHLNIISIHLPL